jgi:hypothetical protein
MCFSFLSSACKSLFSKALSERELSSWGSIPYAPEKAAAEKSAAAIFV